MGRSLAYAAWDPHNLVWSEPEACFLVLSRKRGRAWYRGKKRESVGGRWRGGGGGSRIRRHYVHTASERRGNNSDGCKNFHREAKPEFALNCLLSAMFVWQRTPEHLGDAR